MKILGSNKQIRVDSNNLSNSLPQTMHSLNSECSRGPKLDPCGSPRVAKKAGIVTNIYTRASQRKVRMNILFTKYNKHHLD